MSVEQSISPQDDVFPLVSVILPVFNGAPFLLKSVRSILAQTYSNFELIIIDDGSTDNGLDQINTLNDFRIRIFCDGVRKGLAARLNEGIFHSRGKFIARMDADDIAFPQRLEMQVHYLTSHPDIDLLATRAVVFSNNKNELIGLLPFHEEHQEIISRRWGGIYMPHPTWMGKANWFRSSLYKEPQYLRSEDQELLLRASYYSKYHCLPNILLAYRQGSFNLKKTLATRFFMAKAQISIFLEKKEFLMIMAVIGTTAIKGLIDCLAAIPGFEKIFFKRMSLPVDKTDLEKFHDILEKY